MKRRLTQYENDRLDLMLQNWVRSKQGSVVGGMVLSNAFSDAVQIRSSEYQCRIPVLQADAELIDEIMNGRAGSQFRRALPPMPDALREPLRLLYLDQQSQLQIAVALNIGQPTVSRRVKAARLYLAAVIFEKCDPAVTRASA